MEDAENLIPAFTISATDNKAKYSSDSNVVVIDMWPKSQNQCAVGLTCSTVRLQPVIMISFSLKGEQKSVPGRLLSDFVCPQSKHVITFYHGDT